MASVARIPGEDHMLLVPFQPTAAAQTLYWRRTFPGRLVQAPAVREFVTTLLPDRPRLDEILLAVGELVTNALQHTESGQGGTFTVEVLHDAERTAVSVTDEGGPAEPTPGDEAEPAECGRGLRTVSLLADTWGWHGNEHGRTVIAVFAAEPQGPHAGVIPRPAARRADARRTAARLDGAASGLNGALVVQGR